MSNDKGKSGSDSKPNSGGQNQVREGAVKGNTLPTYQAPPPPPPPPAKDTK